MKLSLYLARATPAVLIALLALLIAASGTALAVSQGNGNALVQKNSLSGNRLKPDTLTGDQVREGTLGKVPRAASADLAESLPRGLTQPLELAAGWEAATDEGRSPAFSIDLQGYVHLEGVAIDASGAAVTGAQIGRLPAAARPAADVVQPVYTGTGQLGFLRISPSGDLVIESSTPDLVSLEGVTFLVGR